MNNNKAVIVNNKRFIPYLSESQIIEAIEKMAKQINQDFHGKKPLFIAVLNGSFIFAAELFKRITLETEICFIKLASYKGTQSTGHVITSIGLDVNIKDRDVIVLEDIIDTGNTLHAFLPQLTIQQPNSLKIAVLLHKPEAQKKPLNIDYCCFKIPDKFVLGYGLDYDGLARNLPGIYQLDTENN